MDVLAFLTLDIQRPNISAIVYGMQGDRQSRAIRAQLVDGSTQWTPPAGTFFVISYAKPDGTHGIYSQTETGNAAVTVSGSVATIALAEQVLTVAGDVPMTLTMFSADGERLSAFTWLLIVKPAAYSDAAFMSTDYYNLLTEQIAAVLKAEESITGLTATATTLAPGSAVTVTVTGGTGADDPLNLAFGIPRGNTGAQGETGAAAEITAQIVEYQVGTSGTTAPTGEWSTTVPTVPDGQYLWTRSTITFNSGSPVISYSVSRMGIDGTGSVKSVNNQHPDTSGDILLAAENIPTHDYPSIAAALAAKVNTDAVIDIAHGGTGADNIINARKNLGAQSLLHTATEIFTSNEYGWISFAPGRKVLSASFNTYNYLLPGYYAPTNQFIANVGVYINVNAVFINLEPNTSYQITYTYYEED